MGQTAGLDEVGIPELDLNEEYGRTCLSDRISEISRREMTINSISLGRSYILAILTEILQNVSQRSVVGSGKAGPQQTVQNGPRPKYVSLSIFAE